MLGYSRITRNFIQFSGNSSYTQLFVRSAGNLGQRVYTKFHACINLFYFEIPEFLHYFMRGTSSACRGENAWAAYLETVVMIYFQQRKTTHTLKIARSSDESKRRRGPSY